MAAIPAAVRELTEDESGVHNASLFIMQRGLNEPLIVIW